MMWYWHQKQWRYDVVLEENSGFGGTDFYKHLENSKKEEDDHILKTAPLAVGAGAVDSYGVKANHTRVKLDVLKERRRVKEVVS